MSQSSSANSVESRRLLVERVAASRHVNRSARLRNLLLHLTDRVLNDDAGEIHEQEVGHAVFGRPKDYDTASDNIVRVHASMLRKRLEQYFASEGANETLVLEIPKGNYAPVFRERAESEMAPPAPARHADWRLWALGLAAGLFASSTVFLLLRGPAPAGSTAPTVRLFWAQIFQPGRQADIVLDDAAVGLYQELTSRQLTLSSYFDRTYLRTLDETAADAHLDQEAASAIVLRRQSSFAGVSFLWKLFQMPAAGQRHAVLRFARDYSFRDLKANNAVLVGNSRSNPWVEPFEARLGLRWVFDSRTGTYYPVDTWAGGQKYQPTPPGDTHEGYCAIALLPNLGHTGNVAIVTATGGSALNAGADFLADERGLAAMRRALPASRSGTFPHFEALLKVKGRGALARGASIVICRPPRG